MVELYHHLAGEHLRISAHFRDVLDQPARDAFAVQDLVPFLSRAPFNAGNDEWCQLGPILYPFFHGREPIIGKEVIEPGHFAESLPEPLIPAGDNDMPITSFEGFVRSDAWMLVSQSLRTLARGKVDARLIRE